jgi:hypothetical protein
MNAQEQIAALAQLIISGTPLRDVSANILATAIYNAGWRLEADTKK